MANIVRRVGSKVKCKFIYEYNNFRIMRDCKKIVKFKNAYEGKRCFIVGNGPSLTLEDLEKIRNEYCFGTHRVYQIFDKTQWRPTFYCAQDYKLIQDSSDEISRMDNENKFLGMVATNKYKNIAKATYIRMILKPFYPELPLFSEDMLKGFYEGFTVTYMCLQLAIYMGFKEIYLIGVDHNYSIELNPDGTLKEDKSIKDHFSDDDKITNIPQTFKSTLAYISAQKYAEKHNIMIYNLTRGGKLDAFPRKKLEEII